MIRRRLFRAAALAAAVTLPALAAAQEHKLAPADEARAHQRACDGGDMTHCIHLGILYRHGAGVDRDPRKALELFVAACEKGYSLACAFTGDMAYLGSGVSPNSEHGLALMRAACNRRNEWACETLRRHKLLARDAVS